MKKLLIIPVAFLLLSFVIPQSSMQVLKTQLLVTVLDDLGNIEKGARVTIYANEEDYNKLKNPVFASELTNEKGRVRFIGLKAQPYYVAAEKGDDDNFLRGEKTKPLQKGRLNKINVIID